MKASLVCVIVFAVVVAVIGIAWCTTSYVCRGRLNAIKSAHHTPSILDDMFSKYPGFIYPRKKQIQTIQLLKRVIATLNFHGIQHWSIGGTLLGQVRNGGIIPWDDDVDLGVLNIAAVEKIDWNSRGLVFRRDLIMDNFVRVYDVDEILFIDIFEFVQEKNRDYTMKGLGWGLLPPDRISSLFPLRTMPFHGIDLPVPNGTEEYLRDKFGPNWGSEAYVRFSHVIDLYCVPHYQANMTFVEPLTAGLKRAIRELTEETTRLSKG